MKTAIVTGASGFIGRRLCEKLIDNGYYVYGIVTDIKRGDLKNNHCNLNYIELNLVDNSNTDKIPNNIDVLFHLAWIGVDSDLKNNFETQMLNLNISLNVIKLVKSKNINKIICIGSAAEYAYLKSSISGEDFPSPSDYYSIIKSSARMLFEYHSKKDGFDFNYVIVPSVYGPGRLDNNIITYSIKSLLNGETPKFTKLEQLWNYIYIDDLIDGIYLVAKKGLNLKTYPLGSNKERPLYEYIKIIHELINPKAKLGIGELPYKSKDVDNCIMDCSSAYEDLGFVAKVEFESGIVNTIDYIKKL